MSEIKSITVQGTAINVKDETARTNLASEISRATAAEGVLDGKISDEETRAVGVESGLNTRLTSAESSISELQALSNCVGLSWNKNDIIKTLHVFGDHAADLDAWIDTSARPCEVKKDMTDFAYLNNLDFSKRINDSASHWNTSDKADYLQMVELQNINVRYVDGPTSMVLFNFDETCPSGYHRWFVESTKLIARYDSTKNTDESKLNVMKGASWSDSNSVDTMYSMNAATNANILEMTGWEIAVLSWLMAFRYRSFDLQNALGRGIESGSKTAAENFVNGTTDTLTTPHGKVSTTGGEAVRFMYIENPYGLRWIWGAGVCGQLTTGYFTYNDLVANEAKVLNTSKADETFTIVSTSGTYAKNVNALGVLTESGGSSSSGFYDGNWSNTGSTDRILYCGGYSGTGSLVGPFARHLYIDSADSYWALRSRCGVRKSVVS